MNRYQQLAEQLKLQIENGIWRAGEKVPSVRMTSRNCSVSASTVLQAYQLLESQAVSYTHLTLPTIRWV